MARLRFRKKSRILQEIPTGPMADISFLLIIFFTVTTTFATTGVSLDGHLTALRRDAFTRAGVRPIGELSEMKHGQRVRIGGLVVARQKPPTAKGFAFLAVEDPDGMANVVVSPDVFAVCRQAMRCAFVLVDGDVLEVDETGAHQRDPVSADYVYVDGLGVGDIDHVVLRDRQHLATDGMIVVVIAVDKRSGRIAGRPDVVSRGFVDVEESEELMERTRDMVVAALEGAEHIADWGVVHSKVKEAIAKFLYEETRRRPMVLPVAIEV